LGNVRVEIERGPLQPHPVSRKLARVLTGHPSE
jgi:hypothetical protein